MEIRKRIFDIIQRDIGKSRGSRIYDVVMMVLIIASIVPMTFTTYHPVFRIVELVSVSVFIIDYILRWITADYKLGKGALSFVLYPFTFMAAIDLLSIIPVFTMMSDSFKLLRLTRLFRIARLVKLVRYTDKLDVLIDVVHKERKVLGSVLVVAVFYVFITALLMFNVEPLNNPITGEPTFETFFDALYWATVTLTTVGYGDVCPVTDFGRFVSMVSSIFGVAIIALPSGVITASYLEELRKADAKKKEEEEAEEKAKTPENQ